MKETIPKGLIEQIKDGNVILFLGAGAAFDSKHPDNKKPPTGIQLANLIAEKFLGKEYLNRDLQYVSELAISETGLSIKNRTISALKRSVIFFYYTKFLSN